jgi:Fe-S-cluster containining protein
LCCRYFVLEIDKPESRRQFDDVRWYLVHEGTFVFIEKKKWYLGVYARCKHLMADNRCGIYEKRPQICRDYSTENCDYHGGDYGWEKLFSSAEQLEEYAKEKLAKMAAKKKREKEREARAATAAKAPEKRVRRKRRRPLLQPALLQMAALGVGGSTPRNGHANGNGNGKGIALPVLGR